MGDLVDFSVLKSNMSWLNHDYLRIIGVEPVYVQFTLILVLMLCLLWIGKPVIRWFMHMEWSMLLNYVLTSLVVLVFLLVMDGFLEAQSGSEREHFWPINLMAIAISGACYIFWHFIQRFMFKSSKHAKSGIQHK
ncbi:hypothetical protein [Thalassobacillus sp. CUG 92003]|uniref:hypothetical protein n=1 Tax=Thalassobacillus sp. CUG 92003 TaxID=2736641 RepID=UPI0015E6B60C|nr:hypothetical protein [Thalassobacillus sp. CUG 92003]